MNQSRIQRSGRGIQNWSVIFLFSFSFILPLFSVQKDPVLARPLNEVIPSETGSKTLEPVQALFNDRQSETSPESPLFLGNPDTTVTLNIPGPNYIGQNVGFT
ncbi:MAG: hypothetical protein MUO54_03435, partial [Anaerolineales bacterium]|nr:hypothetical protein [Anaerolineales bacterium]